jgi:proteasome lid subunit RPN8/RPN11
MKREHQDLMLMHVQGWFPEEACGILGGIGGEVREVHPVTNVLHSPVRYRMDPKEQYDVMRQVEDSGQVIVGIFHSHVSGPEGPSITDLSEANYPESAYLIWSRLYHDWVCKAFIISEGRALEIPILIHE